MVINGDGMSKPSIHITPIPYKVGFYWCLIILLCTIIDSCGQNNTRWIEEKAEVIKAENTWHSTVFVYECPHGRFEAPPSKARKMVNLYNVGEEITVRYSAKSSLKSEGTHEMKHEVLGH